ncbi:MAG TPA: CocE/NonD family hydrolase [Anaerolineales bacterium]
MKSFINFKVLLTLVLIIVGVVYFFNKSSNDKKISELGQYHGYSEAIYDGSVRYSDYLTLANGTLLAYDLILPTNDDVPASEPLPVLFKYTPYLRTFTVFDENGVNIMADSYDLTFKEKAMLRVRYWVYDRGHLMDPLFRTKWLEDMVYHGYAVIVVERPGTGASFGTMDPSFEVGAQEADEILDWIAAQEWSDGNIGMFGDSWQAQIQFAAASSGNPHLKAIFPVSGSMDNYSSVIYPGGVYNKAFGGLFSKLTALLETVVTPVDQDVNGDMLAQALAERAGSTVGEESSDVFARYPFRDTLNSRGKKMWEDVFALYPMLDEINQANIPIYLVNGWYDIFTKDMFIWYVNLSTSKRLLVLPYDHSGLEGESSNFDLGAEAHRWFDYWLKGIDNGIMNEPPIHYSLMDSSEDNAWQTAQEWPLANSETTSLYFSDGKTGSVASVNDGFAVSTPPISPNSQDVYRVDYSTTSGAVSRWTAVNWERDYPDMSANDAKALTYTTAPLESNLLVIGHPLVHLWLVTTAPDLDVFVYLEEVDAKGNSTYITEGTLRASHRLLVDAPYNDFGLPFYRHYESDLLLIQDEEPFEISLELLPTAWRFHSGSRIRVTLAFADADNFDTPVLDPAPEVRLLRDVDHPSYIELP